MHEITLGRQIFLRRCLVAIVVVPVLLCMTLIAWGAVTIAHEEFSRAVGVSDDLYPVNITRSYRLNYHLWWSGPVLGAIWAGILLCRKRRSLMSLICYVHFALIFVTVWGVFGAFAMYFANQTFWGWQRVIVGHDVFVDKGFSPGQEPLVPGGDALLSGELYDGKWGTLGAMNVLRNATGTSTAKKSGEPLSVSDTPRTPNRDNSRVNGDLLLDKKLGRINSEDGSKRKVETPEASQRKTKR